MQVKDQWVPGKVVKLADTPRSYIVRGPSGQEYRCNHRHLKKVDKTIVTSSADDEDESGPAEQAQENVEPADVFGSTDLMTREPTRTSCVGPALAKLGWVGHPCMAGGR